jgi:phospholipid/cholesterol/gamma-HCH transport system substrate-binding protein
VDSVVQIFQAVLGNSAREDLVKSFASIRTTLENLQVTSARLNGMVAADSAKFNDILSKVQSISTNLANNNEPLSRAIKNIANITDTVAKSHLKAVIDSTASVMARTAAIMNKVNNGEGTMGMLINNKKLYTDLTNTNESLNALLVDLKAHPKRYFSVFGHDKTPKNSSTGSTGSTGATGSTGGSGPH